MHKKKHSSIKIKKSVQVDDFNEKYEPSSYSQILEKDKKLERRSFLSSSLSVLSSSLFWYGNGMEYTDSGRGIQIHPQSASAMGKPGLVQFPCKNGLANTYYMMRAGQSLLEADDILTTNPLFLTNKEAALSDTGVEQVENACQQLEEKGVTITRVKYSLATSCVETANIVGKELKVGRDRLVPEFTFMDPRAIGMWDMSTLSVIEPAIWALDVDEAGRDGLGGTPPPNDDGTPNETLSTQVIRLRQLMSVLETQFSGDNILLIFPDGSSPALLTALIGGLPLNRIHELNFKPAEVQFNITYESARARMPSYTNPDDQSTDEEYLETIEFGRKELQKLRDYPDTVINVKDLEYEKILREEEEKAALLKQSKAAAKLEENRIREAKLEADRLAKERKMLEKREQENREKEKRYKANDVLDGNEANENRVSSALTAVAAITAIAFASVTSNKTVEGIDSLQERRQKLTTAKQYREADKEKIGNITEYKSFANNTEVDLKLPETATSNTTEIRNEEKGKELRTDIEQPHLESKKIRTLYDDNDLDFDSPEKRAKKAMEAYMNQDDGGDAWLQMLSEMAESGSDDK